MKLSKEYLMLAFHLAVQHFTKNLKSYYNRQSFTDAELRETFDECAAALKNDTLEIEGYERVQWTRFNPQDSDTFPPPGHYLSFSSDDDEVYPVYRSDKCNDEIFASLSHDMEYWRAFPKPPTEIKESK